MGLKRQYSFRWRILVPLVVMLWCIIAFLMWQQYSHEKEYRRESIESHLGVMSASVLKAHKQGYDTDEMAEFLKSLALFFEDSRYEGVRMTVYTESEWNENVVPQLYLGQLITRPQINNAMRKLPIGSDFVWLNDNTFFGYSKVNDDIDPLRIFMMMDLNQRMIDSLRVADFGFWSVLLILLVITTGFTYYIVSRISSNIKMLRDFAARAKDEGVEFDESKFPHNELGDISRDIVRLYRERSEALKKSRREHDVAIHAIEEKSRIKRQLTNNINHEIKTPVGVIKGYLDTVLSSPDMDDTTRMYFLKRASDNVDRLCNLLNDVSTMTRLEDGSGNIPMRAIDFHDLVYGIQNDFESSHLNGGMSFEYEVPFDCEVLGNEGLLAGAMTNLAKNAVLHSQGTAMGIRLVAESEQYYTFAFWDNGRGVDPSYIPHLFDRFFRVDTGRSRKTGGTGLGLPIVKNTIEAMGGVLSVHNRSNGGLEFVFTLKKYRNVKIS